MTHQQHLDEAVRYDRLASEAHNQVASAMPPAYYEKKALEHRAAAA